ncbi:unnamed protein product [Boreogadus saida]
MKCETMTGGEPDLQASDNRIDSDGNVVSFGPPQPPHLLPVKPPGPATAAFDLARCHDPGRAERSSHRWLPEGPPSG